MVNPPALAFCLRHRERRFRYKENEAIHKSVNKELGRYCSLIYRVKHPDIRSRPPRPIPQLPAPIDRGNNGVR